ncbi:aminoacyl-tRNA hydrolase [Candidatus Gracilibacteria bacterium]|nr:aminoacyl-tRNA hydrolase [Candidatus Gracilibacteria bacterium]NUJ98311.1 aminoacyl-tRNA hydrolase [Candidatus Gracilibacteria bacterium]NUJ99334.1 aminoacyl-tRNA hydrolase [Candidatus Gracilibacteria bacterium]
MKLIVGLGNPGKEYEITRHNLGFLFLDYFQKKQNLPEFSYESKFKGDITTGLIKGEKVILLKPQTFMNLSGESIKKCSDFYKMSQKDMCIIYDDISMDFGKIRTRETGTAGGHNGIKDIIQFFGQEFQRIKFGIGYNSKYEVSDWVLSKFSEEEQIELENKYFSEIEKELLNIF